MAQEPGDIHNALFMPEDRIRAMKDEIPGSKAFA
jgi:hypothetical protein